MFQLRYFLRRTSKADAVSALGPEPIFELLECDEASAIFEELDWISAEFLAPTETTAADLAGETSPFSFEISDEIYLFETDGLAEPFDGGTPGPAFVWKEPRDWFAPARQLRRSAHSVAKAAAEMLVADAQLFMRRSLTAYSRIRAAAGALREALDWWLALPQTTVQALMDSPETLSHWWATRPWNELLSVRRGFVFGALAGFSIAGSGLWALSTIPALLGHSFETTTVPAFNIPMARGMVPTQLAWFFIQYPYVSQKALIRPKNFHTYVISDADRRRDYVVTVGQKFRRVEIYSKETSAAQQVQIYTPGQKKTVWIERSRVASVAVAPDGNLWMWKSPLWNDLHFKIYGLADRWMDSPYKRYSCAGFVHKFLLDAGVRVPILDAWDMAKQPWTQIDADEMEPGDIITIRAASAAHRRFWHHKITHVGVYIGNGKMIHAATNSLSPRAWVRIADVKDFHGRIDKILRPPELN